MIKILIGVILILLLAVLGGYYYSSLKGTSNKTISQFNQSDEATGSSNLSDDPSYQDVAQKYNLTEEQLQILSTVHQGDN